MAESFKVGDLVELKSGGPTMTVTYLGQKISTTWFIDAETRSASFPSDSLRIADTEKK